MNTDALTFAVVTNLPLYFNALPIPSRETGLTIMQSMQTFGLLCGDAKYRHGNLTGSSEHVLKFALEEIIGEKISRRFAPTPGWFDSYPMVILSCWSNHEKTLIPVGEQFQTEEFVPSIPFQPDERIEQFGSYGSIKTLIENARFTLPPSELQVGLLLERNDAMNLHYLQQFGLSSELFAPDLIKKVIHQKVNEVAGERTLAYQNPKLQDPFAALEDGILASTLTSRLFSIEAQIRSGESNELHKAKDRMEVFRMFMQEDQSGCLEHIQPLYNLVENSLRSRSKERTSRRRKE